jgi:hypothetical protein
LLAGDFSDLWDLQNPGHGAAFEPPCRGTQAKKWYWSGRLAAQAALAARVLVGWFELGPPQNIRSCKRTTPLPPI